MSKHQVAYVVEHLQMLDDKVNKLGDQVCMMLPDPKVMEEIYRALNNVLKYLLAGQASVNSDDLVDSQIARILDRLSDSKQNLCYAIIIQQILVIRLIILMFHSDVRSLSSPKSEGFAKLIANRVRSANIYIPDFSHEIRQSTLAGRDKSVQYN